MSSSPPLTFGIALSTHDVSLILDLSDGALPAVVHWGASLGDLQSEDLAVLADHAMHHQRLMNARNTLVPLAKRRAELDMASYAAGKLDLGSALLSTLALAEAEVDALAREADVARDAIRINFTYGEMRP